MLTEEECMWIIITSQEVGLDFHPLSHPQPPPTTVVTVCLWGRRAARTIIWVAWEGEKAHQITRSSCHRSHPLLYSRVYRFEFDSYWLDWQHTTQLISSSGQVILHGRSWTLVCPSAAESDVPPRCVRFVHGWKAGWGTEQRQGHFRLWIHICLS